MLTKNTLAPLMFIGHGSPTLAAANTEVTRQIATAGTAFSDATAILVLSAHWQTKTLQITGSIEPQIIYDFYGFEPELYQLQYQAKVDKSLAERIAQQLSHNELATTVNMERGIDHGVWAPLLHLLPHAQVPILQLSIPQHASTDFYFKLGQAMQEFRAQGIAIIGSGNVTHNLGALRFDGEVDSKVANFERWVRDNIENNRYQDLIDAPNKRRDFKYFHPTIEHYIPLLFVLGAVDTHDKLTLIKNPIDLGVISMDSYLFTHHTSE